LKKCDRSLRKHNLSLRKPTAVFWQM